MGEELYSDYTVSRALRGHIVIRTINLFLGFAFQILVVKILVPAEYAAYAVLLAFLMTAQLLILLGIDRTILRFVPHFTKKREFSVMWRLLGKLAAIRLTSILIFISILVLARIYVFQLLHVELNNLVLTAIILWFAALTILADADALSQSWMMHFHAALIATLELLARISIVIFFYIKHEEIGFNTIVFVSTATVTIASVLLSVRLLFFANYLKSSNSNNAIAANQINLDVSEAPSYATASYISTLGWVLTGQALLRIVASTGLGFIALGAFSFAQGLLFSITRALPGMLILPAIEPVLMAELAGGGRSPRTL